MKLIKDGVNYFTLTKEDNKTTNSNEVQNNELMQEDNYLEQVKEYIKENDAISISRIQAEFGVGYPRASKIMRLLIEEGLVEINADGKYLIKM